MFCTNCGKEIERDTMVCRNCGVVIEADVTQHEAEQYTPPRTEIKNQLAEIKKQLTLKKPGKKAIIAISVVAVAIIAVVIFLVIFNQPEARMNRAIAAGNIQEAYQIYENELYRERLSEKTLGALEDAANSAASAYEDGSISYEVATKILDDICDFIFWADAPTNIVTEAENRIESLYDYKSYLSNAEEYYSEEDYLNAKKNYEYALELNPDSEAASDGISKSEAAYRDYILSQANTYLADKDYDYAEQILNSGLAVLQNDSALKTALDGIYDAKVKDIVDEAYSYTTGGDWDSAVELLEDAQSQYSENQSITEAYEDITERMPITLKNITVISSGYYETVKDVVKDRYGNVYDGAVKFSACSGNDNEVYALYNLNNKFTKFTAIAFVGKDSDRVEDCSISIYLDDELVLYKDGITVDTAPINIELDVTGKNTLRIKISNRWWLGANIYFGNSDFAKIENN